MPSERLLNRPDHFRSASEESALESSLDKRYAIATAHSTVFRFRKPLTDPEGLVSKLETFREFDFGQFEVTSLELVLIDWYQRKSTTKPVAFFKMGC